MFLPLFLISPFVESRGDILQRLSVPWVLFARGFVGMLVSVTAIAALTPGELHEGLRALKLPPLVATLVLQIVHQSGLLIEETRRISAALSLRGGSESATGTWRILSAMPRVWLPRVIHRAERLAMTMELRGYGIDMPGQPTTKAKSRDFVSIALAGCWLLLVLCLRNPTGRS
jgi:cobalt/nickel transport system permease protein